MKDEEKDFWEKYIKPQYSLIKRLKRKIFGPLTRKRIKTIDDFDFMDYDFLIKLFCIVVILMLLRIIGQMIVDVYLWFFPRKILYVEVDPFFKSILYRIKGLIYS